MDDRETPAFSLIRLLGWLGVLIMVATAGYNRLSNSSLEDRVAPVPSWGILNEEGTARYAAEDYATARTLFARAVTLNPENVTLRKNLSLSLAGLGWTAYREGRFDDALIQFDQALEYDMTNGDFWIGKAAVFFRLRRGQEAFDLLREGLRLSPDHPGGHGLLGELYYETNDFERAVREWEIAVTLDPDDPNLRTRLETVRNRHGILNTFQRRSEHRFTVLFEGPERDVPQVLSRLDDAYQQVGAAMSYYPNDDITVILYTQTELRDATHGPSWASALYDGKIHIPLGGSLDLSRLGPVVTHEYTHAVIHRMSAGRAPAWLNEGLAMYFDGGRPPTRGHSEPAALPPLTELPASFVSLDAPGAAAAYSSSWHAVRYLIERYGTSRAAMLLTALSDPSIPFERQFERVMLISLSDFDAAWRDWASSQRMLSGAHRRNSASFVDGPA